MCRFPTHTREITVAKELYHCIRKCAWYPTPMDQRGQPTSPLHVYDPESDEVPMGRAIPMSMEYLDPEDPWVLASGILTHFRLPQEIEPDMVESPEQYIARCKRGVRAPINSEVMSRLSTLEQGAANGKPMQIDGTKLPHADDVGERARASKTH